VVKKEKTTPFQTYGLPAKAPLAGAEAPACTTVETRTAVNSVDRGVDGASCSIPAAVISRSTPTPMAARAAITISRAIRICSTRPDRSTSSAEFGRAGGWRVDRRLVYLRRRLHRRCDHADRCSLPYPGIDGADHLTRIDAHQTKITAKGEYRPDSAAINAVRFWRVPPTTGTTRWPCRSPAI